MSDFSDVTIRRSGRERRCPECGASISVGEKYARLVGKHDGDFYVATSCVPCNDFLERYVKSMWAASFLEWDEATYTRGQVLTEAAEYLGFPLHEFLKSGSLAAARDAMMATFDAFDEEERAYVKLERENAAAARAFADRVRRADLASVLMVRGMSAAGRAMR